MYHRNVKPSGKQFGSLQSYARSYAHFGIHHEMLSDRARTLAYKRAIELNSTSDVRDRRVLDVGCGTGILSMFCARAGARAVTAVDMSSIIEQVSREGIVRALKCY